MNLLGLIFSLLLILSFGFYSCWDKHLISSRLRTTYIGHEKVNRKIFNRYQREIYRHLPAKSKPVKLETAPQEKTTETAEPRVPKPELNRECAKLNLWPLIQEGRDKHQMLYELAAKMIRTFYGSFQAQQKRFEYHFLDALIAAAKSTLQQPIPFALEKIELKDSTLQRLYYKMLKGTKHRDFERNLGYPSLLDYLKAEPSTNKICLFHAHPDLIALLFNQKVATRLHAEIHRKDAPLLSRELIERMCSEMHQITIDPELFTLLELGRPQHEEHKKTLIAEDRETDVSLRRNVYFKG